MSVSERLELSSRLAAGTDEVPETGAGVGAGAAAVLVLVLAVLG